MKTSENIKALGQQAFNNHLEFLSTGRIEEWVDLFTEDGVLEFPYATKGTDFLSSVSGKKDLFDYMKNFPEHFKEELENLHFHATEEPTLVNAEFTRNGYAISTGKPYLQKYISVVTTTPEGKILKNVDFWNPLTAFEAMNAPLDKFLAATAEYEVGE
ncbi:nuclear transport factor 2 family protein [Telluribacter humicola]|uniref:nuclear transport factor 2 family protein n=1 Tax=Telluribacter humicola TaxID=1720261 RepID=UPI001A96D1C9|nr:nuclear transport factor 2 family protein [Telluribacter humicola]